MKLSITFLSHSNNYLLFETLKSFFENTSLDNLDFDIHLLLQNCGESYLNSIHHFKKSYYKEKFNIHNLPKSIGISKANNFLAEKVKESEFVLHLEDDWIYFKGKEDKEDKEWLKRCISRLDENPNLSTITLRRFGTEKEKEDYGWTKNIFYKNHQFEDNFNYQSKMGEPILFQGSTFTPISRFLFTFNPTIRRNKDYYLSGVYPLPELPDYDTELEYSKGKKIHNAKGWGWCEAMSMEKIIHLQTEKYEEGIFVHVDDWVEKLMELEYCPFNNDLTFKGYDINCHIPILIIKLEDALPFYHYPSHPFLWFYNFHFFGDYSKRKEELQKVVSFLNPRVIITIGNLSASISNLFAPVFAFEYRRRWLHLSSFENLNLTHIEHCCFNFKKHPGNKDHPIISVITPAYESKHRILRPYHSLLNQTYPNWEWIVIDDSKTDDTWKTLSSFAEKDFRIKIFKREKNSGSIGSNKLFCGNLATGQFIFELDHDDDILPHTFQRLIDASRRYPDAGFFYSDFIECSEDSLTPFSYGEHFGLGFGSYYRQWWKNDFHFIAKSCRMNPHTFRHIVGVPNHFRCWTREAYQSLGGHDPNLQVADDYDLILRTMFKYRWVHIPELLYIQYRNQGGDNGTFTRNALIQYLVKKLQQNYNNEINNRLTSLGVEDDVNTSMIGQGKDFEIVEWKYPVIDWVYHPKDQDKNNPLISIVIPTYNRPKHLERALESIFSQGYQNFEILIVGDKCPALESFIRSYPKAKDDRVKWYNLQTNYGPGGAVPRNYALKMMASSRWIAYLDDDNIWLSNHLEIAVNEIRKDSELKLIVNSIIINDKPLIFNDFRKGRVDTSVVVHHFEMIEKYGGWKDRKQAGYAHDWEFFSRMKEEKKIFTEIPTLIYSTEFNGQSYDQLIGM